MSEELAAIIREEIRQKGPIPFSRWMELCLYHPQYGYYMKPGRKTGYGRDADFVTPPTLHPFLGRAVADEIAQSWQRNGRMSPFIVVEHGGGEGDMARQALTRIDERWPELGRVVEWRWAERSPRHAMAHASSDLRIQPAGGVEPFRAHFWVLCEVLDAVAVDVGRRTENGWEQLFVGSDEGRFAPVWQPTAHAPVAYEQLHELVADGAGSAKGGLRQALDAARAIDAQALQPNDVPIGGPVLLQGERERLLDGAADLLCGGIVVDYGDSGRNLRRADDGLATVRGFRRHQLVDDVLSDPGDVDLTASVDFSLVSVKALDAGMQPAPLESLEAFLLRHGILEELNSIDRNTVEGASSYLRLRQLLLPTGMGAAFKVQRFDRVPPPTLPT